MRFFSFLIVAGLALPAAAQCPEWSDEFSEGLDLFGRAIAVVEEPGGPTLYAGGDFQSASGSPAEGIARWTGTEWEAVGMLPSRGVRAIAGFDDGSGHKLYVGTSGYGNTPRGLYCWDGVSWNQIGGGGVEAMAVYDYGAGPELYALSSRWNGVQWEPVFAGPSPVSVTHLSAEEDGFLYLGGTVVPSSPSQPGQVWRYDGTLLTLVAADIAGPIGFNVSVVQTVHVHDDGSGPAVYVGGDFTSFEGQALQFLVRSTATGWEQVGGAPDRQVFSLETFDPGDGRPPLLIAGGSFTTMGMVAASRIAAWDGTSWAPLGTGLDSRVIDMVSFADGPGALPDLWAVGKFVNAGTIRSEHVARWQNPCAGEGTTYCTAGTTASGCNALVSSTGSATRSLASGFDVRITGSEGNAPGVVFFGTSGAQANPWGNGTSVRCVAPPFVRTGLQQGSGTPGLCDGSFQLDFNAWMSAHPAKAPGGGQSVHVQCWFRDAQNTSNQGTSLSDGLRFTVLP